MAVPPAVSFAPRGRANALCDTHNAGHASNTALKGSTTSFPDSASWRLNSPFLSEDAASVLVETHSGAEGRMDPW